MGVFPLSKEYREQLADRLQDVMDIRNVLDPLAFLRKEVLAHYPGQDKRVLPQRGETPFFEIFIRNLELSAWAVRPPIIVALMRAFQPVYDYNQDIQEILEEGPYQCHPQNQPYYVCRVLMELPLIGRAQTRLASVDFERGMKITKSEGKRILRVFGPSQSGKTHTLRFFEYLAAVQPLKFGVMSIDFGNTEMVTQAADASIPIELFLAQQLEAQVNRRRGELIAEKATPAGEFPDLMAIVDAIPEPHLFKPLTDSQQRLRWSSELAREFVDHVIYRLDPVPQYWVAVFDNCEKASPEAKEFLRQLVTQAAGIASESGSVARADEGSLRIVLLGDSQELLPPSIYANHVRTDDLNQQNLGVTDLEQYFRVFSRCRVELDEPRIAALAAESLNKANEIQAKDATIPRPRALADAVSEKSLALEALAAQKGGANGS
ncbi:MAG TPA: hypothetical protein VFS90_11665 [Pyrinomonadaceae bacterium]|nr:hypothetical protein [Pyrinomonadaceae bacterium]